MSRPSPLLRYGVVPPAVAAAMLVRWPLWPALHGELAFLFLWPVVVACAWYGGLGPGLLATALSATAATYFLLEPRFALAPASPADLVGLLVFVPVNVAISVLCETLHRGRRRAEQQAEEVARERERLRVSLTSIGDAVITVDGQGRVGFLNPTAQALTGWGTDEAAGRPLEDVLHIVNEHTRRPAENPATRVLREGAVVGLANHTLLIARDGTERPIDDSAAPLRGEDGQVVGCVVVFRDITERRRLEKEDARRLHAARLLA